MSLDVYIAKSESGLATAPIVASIQWFDHEALGSQGFFNRGGVLMRLMDYYKDAKIYPAELEQAIAEVKSIKDQCQGETYEMLDQLAAIFEQALLQQSMVYFCAD